MDLKKCFMVSLFLLASVSHVSAIDLHEVVDEFAETSQYTQISYKVQDDFEAPKLSKRQDACFAALTTDLEGYEAQDYMLHSIYQNEHPLYSLYLTHWVPSIPEPAPEIELEKDQFPNEEMPQKALRAERQQPASHEEADPEQPAGGNEEPHHAHMEGQPMELPEGADGRPNGQGEEYRPEPELDEEGAAPPVKMSQQRAAEKQRFQQEGPRKKGLFMLWTLIAPEVKEEAGPVDLALAKAELKKASFLMSLNMVIQKIRESATDHIYLSEDFTPEMQAIVRNMGVAPLKPNTGFTTVINGEPRNIDNLSESLLLDK